MNSRTGRIGSDKLSASRILHQHKQQANFPIPKEASHLKKIRNELRKISHFLGNGKIIPAFIIILDRSLMVTMKLNVLQTEKSFTWCNKFICTGVSEKASYLFENHYFRKKGRYNAFTETHIQLFLLHSVVNMDVSK